MKKPKIKVYSTRSCPYCSMAKDFLKEHKFSFEDIYVDDDEKKAAEMIKKSGQMGVPVIEIGKKIIIGFNVKEIKKELNIK